MIYRTIIKFAFTMNIFLSWATLSIGNYSHTFSEFRSYTDLHLCKNDINTLNFSNTQMDDIGPNFINSSVITCLNFTNNHIQSIAKNTFKNLPNLSYLFFFGTYLNIPTKYYYGNSFNINFGGHKKLSVLHILNSTITGYPEYPGSNYYSQYYLTAVFGSYPNLKILSIRNSSLKNLQSEMTFDRAYYTAVTQKVLFPKLKILDLSENSIEYNTFENFFSNSLEFLDLHSNKLDRLMLNEKASNVLLLNVDNNAFRYIEYNTQYSLALIYLKNLQYLSISNNKVSRIESNAFQDTNKLIYLNLSSNVLSNLDPANIFANLHSLSILDLSSNRLNYVPQISNKTNIRHLYLSCNKIEKIISNNFAQTPKLTRLLLGGNQINEIDVKAFDSLSALEELDLSRNKLSSLLEGWTESFTSLQYLDLSDNMFISLESLSLTNALPLIDLYLATNPLEYFNIKYFKTLSPNLTIHWAQKSNFTQLYKYKC